MSLNHPIQTGHAEDFSELVLPAPDLSITLREPEPQRARETYSYARIKRETPNDDQLSLFSFSEVIPYEASILAVAKQISDKLSSNKPLDMKQARDFMTKAFNGSDADGKWNWTDFYEAQEIAFLDRLSGLNGKKLLGMPPLDAMSTLAEELNRTLTHTKRTEESVRLQQFSTPPHLAYLAALLASPTKADLVLEPSAGTGLLAKCAELHGAKLVLNEYSERRSTLLKSVFPGKPCYSFDAEQIHDFLPEGIRPTVVLINPPFSTTVGVEGRNAEATPKHIRSAFLRLVPGGRMVLISADWFSPTSQQWGKFFTDLNAQVQATATIDGSLYYKHGTTTSTRITVIDKISPVREVREFNLTSEVIPASVQGNLPEFRSFRNEEVLELLRSIPERSPIVLKEAKEEKPVAREEPVKAKKKAPPIEAMPIALPTETKQVTYKAVEREAGASLNVLYEEYRPGRIEIDGAKPHPTKLCESAAMASVLPPMPQYVPLLPEQVITKKLSFAQLESVIYAGEAHSRILKGNYIVDKNYLDIQVASSTDPNAVQFRQGWFLGDGTGAGKGRQIAGVILDNFLHGRTKAVWVSKSEKLVEDAQRDWVALGGNEFDIVSLSKFKQGTEISLKEGILFTTYATLRSQGKQGKESRLDQVVSWLGKGFDGVLAFDEAHAMGNASTEKEAIFTRKASQQGLTGLKIQNAVPDARILYVSATGATKVSNLAYASRLGLWQTGDFPFADREEFISSIESGGVAAMEVVCRDLKSLGLYLSRSLSFDGVEVDPLEVPLTPDQIEIYDVYAEAFKHIHGAIEDALKATNVTAESGKSLNSQSKMSAYSMFESSKQRFFNHLLTAMKCPSLIRAIEGDLREGNSVVVQLVSTNEAIIDRRLKELPTEEWHDLNIDITPRENITGYLMRSFPTHLHKVLSDHEGKLYSEPLEDEHGNVAVSREALEMRDKLIEKIAILPPLPGALEQLLHHFGHDQVAEITGRSIRVLKEPSTGRIYAENRAASASLPETQHFMDGDKKILIFSDAGGTGRSYHADLSSINQDRRIHYGLEFGWKADTAIQGLGRSHRTNQASAPVFRPVVTDVKGERRFISTIARRLDALGALTRGQRQTGGQGMFDPKDNLESWYAEAALNDFFSKLYRGHIACCTMGEFESATGLKLTTGEGDMKWELPNITKFLNRLLALPIAQQNGLFQEFETLLHSNIESAIANGTYDVGVETLQGESFRVVGRETVYSHSTGGETFCVEIEEKQKRRIYSAIEGYHYSRSNSGQLVINDRSGRAAVVTQTSSSVSDTGASVRRVNLMRPVDRVGMPYEEFNKSSWKDVTYSDWKEVWDSEVSTIDPLQTERFFLITGLLLPIWKSLDEKNTRVFRLRTDDGEVLLGRRIEPEDMAKISESLGLSQVTLNPSEIFNLVAKNHKTYALNGGMSIRRSSVMGEFRLEVAGIVTDSLCKQLESAGCFTEIIAFRKRIFLPANEELATPVIEQVSEILKVH